MLDKDEILEQVRLLVESSGKSIVEIAAQCGLPESTIRRALGDGKNPSFIVLCEIIKACSGSVDAIVGVDHAANVQPNEPLLRQLRADLEHERRGRKFNMRLFLAAVIAIIVILLIDLFNPQLGWIRYGTMQQAAEHFAENAAALILCVAGAGR